MRRAYFAVVVDYEARSIGREDMEEAIVSYLGDRNAISGVIVRPVGRRLFDGLAGVPTRNASEDFVSLAKWHLGQISDEQYAAHLLESAVDDPVVQTLAEKLR